MQINHILLFGAGKSATVLINYLIENAEQEHWDITIGDANAALILSKTKNAICTNAVELDINDVEKRQALIANADLVISMMPPVLHFLIAQDCIYHQKNLLTASYVDSEIKSLQNNIEKNNLLFLCEMGLDPGIDHMSAMQLIDDIHKKGNEIISFKSHCGGLVAPESDDNPWRYKISWNPRNIVLAGKAGALYQLNGHNVAERYEELFEPERGFRVNDDIGFLGYYPNRNSLPYMQLYGLENAQTFMRTTLRYPDFLYGWNNVVELGLTNEATQYQTDGMSLADFFKAHFGAINFGDWIKNKMQERIAFVKNLAESLNKLMEAEAMADEAK
jgi:saccharopine dehydrogenase-like NADP-dependent oxidoreductase